MWNYLRVIHFTPILNHWLTIYHLRTKLNSWPLFFYASSICPGGSSIAKAFVCLRLMSCPCHSMCAPIFFSIASKQLVCYVYVWWHMANARLPAGKPFYPYTKVLISTKSLSAAAACVVRRACTDIRGTTTRVLCCVLLLHLNGACGGWGAYYQSSFQQHRHQIKSRGSPSLSRLRRASHAGLIARYLRWGFRSI